MKQFYDIFLHFLIGTNSFYQNQSLIFTKYYQLEFRWLPIGTKRFYDTLTKYQSQIEKIKKSITVH